MDKVNFLGSVRIHKPDGTRLVYGYWEWDGEVWHCWDSIYIDCICEFLHKIK